MFTGLVEERGEVAAVELTSSGARLSIRASLIAPDAAIGESIAVNGCCLTVSFKDGDALTFDLLAETLARTNLSQLRVGASVNLERALAANGRLGGHFVQGHIDCTSRVISFAAVGNDWRLEIELPPEFESHVIRKGSIAIDGISLTVSDVEAGSLVIWIIPHTLSVTNLQDRKAGDAVNLEFDLLAKYVARMLRDR